MLDFDMFFYFVTFLFELIGERYVGKMCVILARYINKSVSE